MGGAMRHSSPACRRWAASFTPIASDLVDPVGVSDVLLASTIKPLSAAPTWGRMLEGIEYWHDILRRGHNAYDIGGLDRDLSGYQLVVLADQLAMSDGELEAIADFVAAGGNLLATGETSLYDELGRRRPDYGLATVFGVTQPVASGSAFTYISRVDPDMAQGLPGTPIVINRGHLRPTSTTARADRTRVRARTTLRRWIIRALGLSAARPDHGAARSRSRNTFGAGQCVYLGVSLDPPAGQAGPWATGGLEAVWSNTLAANVVRSLVPDPVLVTDAPPGVELVLNAHGDHWMLHVLDYQAGDPRYVDGIR